MKESGEKRDLAKEIFLNEEIKDNNLKCCVHTNSSFSKGQYLPLIIIQVAKFFEENFLLVNCFLFNLNLAKF